MATIQWKTGMRHVTPHSSASVVTSSGAVGSRSYSTPNARLPVMPPAPSHVKTVDIWSMLDPVMIWSSTSVGP